DRRWQGRFLAGATLVGPEARGSSPVRIVRDDVTRETPGIEGLYPVGEGAGYAGGIVSAAVDGLRSVKALVAKYAPLARNASVYPRSLSVRAAHAAQRSKRSAPLTPLRCVRGSDGQVSVTARQTRNPQRDPSMKPTDIRIEDVSFSYE